jgi:TrmH family RNA methyltransferase
MTSQAGGSLFTERTPRVVAARKLTQRSHRAAQRRFLAEGPQAVREALAIPEGRPGAVEHLFATEAALARYPELRHDAERRQVPISLVTKEAAASLSETVHPQGLIAVCSFLDSPVEEVTASRGCLVAVLAEIRDPGNAGTILRTADAVGADAVIFSDASVDLYNGKVVRASAGSLFHLSTVRGGTPLATLQALRRAGFRVLAADVAGSTPLDTLTLDDHPVAWVFGNEAQGLSPELLAEVDETVAIPLSGRAESLNLAAAAAICLYQTAAGQRRR